MNFFRHDQFDIAYLDTGPATAEPVLLIHGFASNMRVNWVSPGWVKTLNDAGYRAIAFDHRGHGDTSKSYDPADYTPSMMAGDAAALLERRQRSGRQRGAQGATAQAGGTARDGLVRDHRVATHAPHGLELDGEGERRSRRRAARRAAARLATGQGHRVSRSAMAPRRQGRHAAGASCGG